MERADNSAQGSEGREGVERGDGGDVLADGGKRGRVEDSGVVELGDQEGVGRRGRLS